MSDRAEKVLVRNGRLLTDKQLDSLPEGDYEIEEFTVTTVKGTTVLTESRYKVWRLR